MTSQDPELQDIERPDPDSGRVPPVETPLDADPGDVLDQVEEVPDPEEDDLIDDESPVAPERDTAEALDRPVD
jgi:hypothetical protein